MRWLDRTGGAALGFGLAWLVGSSLAIAEPAAEGVPPQPSQNECRACHEQTLATFQTTAHAGIASSCASCHGDATEHLKSNLEKGEPGPIVSFKKLEPAEANRACLTCHENKGGQKHWAGSAHDSRDVSCVSCHNPHPAAGKERPKALLRASQQQLCTTCHQQKKGALMRSSHMPMREGKLECSSCHNAHGTPHEKSLLQVSTNQNCYSCHAEKRGPFLWEHAPVRESCTTCHDAHGSVQDKLLKVKQPLLCQQCHQAASHPGPAYPAASRYAFNQGCLHCHPAIHGSTHPSGNRFFR
jgi:DmsE family decaheme c-type cytochrome